MENNQENYNYNIKLDTNLLESKKDPSNIFGDSFRNSEFENHFYPKYSNNKCSNQFLDEIPIYSKIFKENIKVPTKFINFNLFFKSNVNRPKVYKNIFRNNFIIEKRQSYANEKADILNNDCSKLYFNVPENFLIKFSIKSIYSENIPLNKNSFTINQINLNDMQNYINNICNINSKSNLNYYNGEYIELRKVDNEQPKNIEFLKHKRENNSNLDGDEKTNHPSEGINPKNGRRKPLKKKNKNNNKKLSLKNKKLIKNNNKKNGIKISLYLNQIQINKNRLEQFPFCQLLNNKENIKIDLLKGITEKKELIKIKKKPEINHQNNLKFILNKKFEIIYQKNENDSQYILFIKGINILYLLSYYYYQIQEEVKLLNKYHYSHASYEKSNKVRNHLENLIKKCNKIVKDISKEDYDC